MPTSIDHIVSNGYSYDTCSSLPASYRTKFGDEGWLHRSSPD